MRGFLFINIVITIDIDCLKSESPVGFFDGTVMSRYSKSLIYRHLFRRF